ncbi:VCBS repeat-containing protein [Streptomyces sp. NBC_01220]|uniref:FG-GAP-like repeat-containing protein n=1 Tax=unclassified Streptomyces TaxID=2593676 RepID=UPI002E2A4B48|nr:MULTISPECIES: FG-GAP-like repeat-containing protein [unclassified Streptomyces]WSQ45957.1 VCBS repeat-containing protein [Streptomyces sp. NBC_01220]
MPARSRRAGRIAACTALVLSAGMLLAAPASADDTAPHRTAVEQPVPALGSLPSLTLPEHPAQKSRAAAVEGAGAAAVVPAKPRLDLDGDGYSDTMYRAINGKVYVEPSTGADSHEYAIYGDSNEQYKDLVAPGDLDGNGRPEFLTLSATGTLSLFQSQSDNNTGYATWSGMGWQIYNKLVGAGDLTGDGRGDMLARTPSGELYLYAANGAVNSNPFKSRVKVGNGWGAYDQLVGANDVTGDGIADFFTRTPAGELYFYAGTGNAAKPFAGRVKVGNGWNGYNQIIAVDDANGDGLGDIVARTTAGAMYYYESTGVGSFLTRSGGGTGWYVASQFVGAGGNPDFGKNEMFGLDTKGSLFWYYPKNNGLFAARQAVGTSGGWGGANLTFTSSLDNDGRAELLELYAGTLYNENYAIGNGWGVYNSLVGPGDLSGDGKGDLLARTKGGTLYLYRGYGTATSFASRINVGGGWDAYDKLVGAGDYNGDGRTDLLARTKGGTLYLYPGTGVASKPFKSRVNIGGGWNTYKKLAAPGDINGDGKADLVGVDGKGDLYRYTSTGTGKFGARARLGGGWGTYANLY